ncbi:hypothetical protein ACFPPD_26495 [Cohnella suwonensis]|uniref:Lipoprotein n=1 Tax=Cohnella suwonensis TaxID=696072 RepID=A0ABW0M5I9_9BACL
MNTLTLGEINEVRKDIKHMKFKHFSLLFSAVVMLALLGCNNSDIYSANKNPPTNVRDSFYKKSVEIMNFYVDKVESRTLYTNEDNEYLLGYYRSTPSNSSEEVMIKTSLTYLDLIYKNFDENLKGNNEGELKSDIIDFQEQLKEVLKLLEMDER